VASKELANTDATWKIPYFHHPLYSSGATHGSSLELRQLLEPVFVRDGVRVVFSGHDHVYERTKPQKGIYYFVEGSGGELRAGDLRQAEFEDSGFDKDRKFMLVEIAGDQLFFRPSREREKPWIRALSTFEAKTRQDAGTPRHDVLAAGRRSSEC
jgi:Calcineurin-like phosphoesterase